MDQLPRDDRNEPSFFRVLITPSVCHEVYFMRLLPSKSHKPSDSLFKDLRSLIIEARQDVARQVNSALVLLYWRVGKRIREDILKEKRAEYGKEILSTLSRKLVAEFGSGFTARNLANMVRFGEVFQDECHGRGPAQDGYGNRYNTE